MKKLYILLAAVIITVSAMAQAPQKISYQAVIRDAGNVLITNQSVGMQISILQGSVSGTAVYVESQTPTTNINSLVSQEIGSGTVVSGTFNTIDWSNGPYFIKTETDPTGGTAYTIEGTSQLMSVPYALYAKTSGSSIPGPKGDTGDTGVDGTDGQGGVTLAGTNVTISGSGTSGGPYIVNSANEVDGSITNEIELPTGGTDGQVLKTDGSGNYTRVNQTIDTNTEYTGEDDIEVTGTVISEYQVGDFAQGGIVFWLDETGEHGLVCAKSNLGRIRWYAGTYGTTQAKGDGPYAGEANTLIIIAAQEALGDDDGMYAARICNELQITEGGKTYGDWYLPSRDELNEMYLNKATIDATALANGGSGFAIGTYWSSTEYGNDYAWNQTFYNGYQFKYSKYVNYYVRAVRAF